MLGVFEESSLLSIALFNLVSAVFVVLLCSGSSFYCLYVKPEYRTWTHKTQAEYPTPQKVKGEILATGWGTLLAHCPFSTTVWLSFRGYGKGFVGYGGYSLPQLLLQQLFFFVFVDFTEFLYHYCGHRFSLMWKAHKAHHQFPNPTPFAVIADETIDQICRSMPMMIYPLLFPANLDLIATQMALYYVYGTYLHCGFELEYPDAHHWLMNTAYNHCAHHAVSIKNKPYYCGFYVKIWDSLFGSVYTGKCFCAKCEFNAGESSLERHKKTFELSI
eukprot:GHVN01013503.1.p1 GENE.GHVN01013503.1~~GHVN01013503.1.p1  ORF type:complete len:274 (+),score=10.50 GHVN01013503.1:30-851(+)